LLLLILASPATHAQSRFLLQGIADAEAYATDADSPLLSRNEGDVATLGRIQLWSAYQLTPSIQLYALAELESHNFAGSFETDAELEQFTIRYTRLDSPYIVAEAGRILSPISVYGERHISTENALIGQLHTLPSVYPIGVQLTGSASILDYRAGLVDLPNIDSAVLEFDPDSAFRPVFGAGVTPLFGLRVGASYTKGPYLASSLNPYLPEGVGWRDYDQRAAGFDFQYAHRYLEVSGEWLDTKYEVPYQARKLDDTTWFLEARYTFTPRVYGAIRLQGVDGAFPKVTPDGDWLASDRDVTDLEVGCGIRLTSDLLLKLSYRRDAWHQSTMFATNPSDGYWWALQLSYRLDPRSWIGND